MIHNFTAFGYDLQFVRGYKINATCSASGVSHQVRYAQKAKFLCVFPFFLHSGNVTQLLDTLVYFLLNCVAPRPSWKNSLSVGRHILPFSSWAPQSCSHEAVTGSLCSFSKSPSRSLPQYSKCENKKLFWSSSLLSPAVAFCGSTSFLYTVKFLILWESRVDRTDGQVVERRNWLNFVISAGLVSTAANRFVWMLGARESWNFCIRKKPIITPMGTA